jgi:hypothetical protein
VRVTLLGKTPAFHYVDIERNGKEEPNGGRYFTITYRDEFIDKKVSTDSLFEKNIPSTWRAWAGQTTSMSSSRPSNWSSGHERSDVRDSLPREAPAAFRTSGSATRTGDRRRAGPHRLTPQDWLRFARNPANAKWQAQALEKALSMKPGRHGPPEGLSPSSTRVRED